MKWKECFLTVKALTHKPQSFLFQMLVHILEHISFENQRFSFHRR